MRFNVDGLWTSKDVLMRLTDSRQGMAPPGIYNPSGIIDFIEAAMELISTKLSDHLEIVDKTYESVMPKRDFRIRIGRGGWTGPEANVRVIIAAILRP